MFYGEYEHSLDTKNRVIIPAKFRDVLKQNYVDKFFITRGLDKCLFIFAEDEWRLQEQKFKTRSFTKSEVRKFNRLFFSGASDVGCDRQGRILVPNYLKAYAEIKKDVFIIGVSNRFEIWAKDKWNNFYNDTKDSFEEIAENLIEE
ncbi:MAG: division/cell wall cluster transcriptional repressor MraZ [Candidatus Omnitrophica bacterium]|nr:division/cell wall cluster transcriptional repressor MraZ [Candidatus Omnitrophota bacterium]